MPMTTIITDKSTTELASYFTVLAGSVEVFISYKRTGSVQVCVNNASHRAFRRIGKTFADFETAVEAYKSDAVRTALFATKAEIAG